MTALAERIRSQLERELGTVWLEVVNESDQHSVPKGSETHFKVVVVSPRFDGLSAVRRHQLVYGLLNDAFQAGLHALAITARSPAEWEAEPRANASPACRGGNGL